MLVADILVLVNQSLQDLFQADPIQFFGGIDVLLSGDENQLKPAIGASLIEATLDGTPAGLLMRLFHKTSRYLSHINDIFFYE